MSNSDGREALQSRRDEILAELEGVNRDQRIELDEMAEEQAIQLEQNEVANSREAGLRRELADIEDKLLDLGE
ncbi:MAG: hypothetical protein ABI999_08935 [Acidobacteriota bacterium]